MIITTTQTADKMPFTIRISVYFATVSHPCRYIFGKGAVKKLSLRAEEWGAKDPAVASFRIFPDPIRRNLFPAGLSPVFLETRKKRAGGNNGFLTAPLRVDRAKCGGEISPTQGSYLDGVVRISTGRCSCTYSRRAEWYPGRSGHRRSQGPSRRHRERYRSWPRRRWRYGSKRRCKRWSQRKRSDQ